MQEGLIYFNYGEKSGGCQGKAKGKARVVEDITPHLGAIKELRGIEGWTIIPETSPQAEPNRFLLR